MMVACMNFFQVSSKEKFKFGSKLGFGKDRARKAEIFLKNLHIPAMLRIFFVVVDLSSAKKSKKFWRKPKQVTNNLEEQLECSFFQRNNSPKIPDVNFLPI
jgi:hypothetical protein